MLGLDVLARKLKPSHWAQWSSEGLLKLVNPVQNFGIYLNSPVWGGFSNIGTYIQTSFLGLICLHRSTLTCARSLETSSIPKHPIGSSVASTDVAALVYMDLCWIGLLVRSLVHVVSYCQDIRCQELSLKPSASKVSGINYYISVDLMCVLREQSALASGVCIKREQSVWAAVFSLLDKLTCLL